MKFRKLQLIFFFLIIPACSPDRINISNNVESQGQDIFFIRTGSTVYHYQKEAGGFSSIIDRDGIDWVQFELDSPSYPASASGSYRGIPNLVYGSQDHGTGHPGFRKCETTLEGQEGIRTVSRSGKWEWTWIFRKGYAVMHIEKSDRPYWFLYEGPVAGTFQPHRQYWGTDKGGPWKNIPDYFLGQPITGHFRWFYFGDENIERVFFMVQVEPDQIPDHFAYLGNTSSGVISPDGMVVAGFGRSDNGKPLLDQPGLHFIIGFYEMKITSPEIHARIADYIQEIIDDFKD
jgi:hypothetical protein